MGLLDFFRQKKREDLPFPQQQEAGQALPPEEAAEPEAAEGYEQPAYAEAPEAGPEEAETSDLASKLEEIDTFIGEAPGTSQGLQDIFAEDAAGDASAEPGIQAPELAADTIYVPADIVLGLIPPQYLNAPLPQIAAQYANKAEFYFPFEKAELMFGLGRGRVAFTLGELIGKFPYAIFSHEAQTHLEVQVDVPLYLVVPLIPVEWMRRPDQDDSMLKVLDKHQDYFEDVLAEAPELPAEEAAPEAEVPVEEAAYAPAPAAAPAAAEEEELAPEAVAEAVPAEEEVPVAAPVEEIAAAVPEEEEAPAEAEELEELAAGEEIAAAAEAPAEEIEEIAAEAAVPEEEEAPAAEAEELEELAAGEEIAAAAEAPTEEVEEIAAEAVVPEIAAEAVAELPVAAPVPTEVIPPAAPVFGQPRPGAPAAAPGSLRPQLRAFPEDALPQPPSKLDAEEQLRLAAQRRAAAAASVPVVPPAAPPPAPAPVVVPPVVPSLPAVAAVAATAAVAAAAVSPPAKPAAPPPPVAVPPKPVAAPTAAVKAGRGALPEPTLEEVLQTAQEVFAPVADRLAAEVKDFATAAIDERNLAWQSQAPNGININLATARELEMLQGVGPHMAEAIIERRQQSGPFQRLQELTTISGLGPHTYRHMTGLGPRTELREAELQLNTLLGISGETINLVEIARTAQQKLKLEAMLVVGADGLPLAHATANEKIAKLCSGLSAVTPQVFKRNTRLLEQARLPEIDMLTCYFGNNACTFGGTENIACVFVHGNRAPAAKQLTLCRKIAKELIWYCSYRAVV